MRHSERVRARNNLGIKGGEEAGLLHHPHLAQIPNPFLERSVQRRRDWLRLNPDSSAFVSGEWSSAIIVPPREYRAKEEDKDIRARSLSRNPLISDGEKRDVRLLPDSPTSRERREERKRKHGTAVDTGSFSAGKRIPEWQMKSRRWTQISPTRWKASRCVPSVGQTSN